MKSVGKFGKYGLLVLCLVCLVLAFSPIVVGNGVPPGGGPPAPGGLNQAECNLFGYYWYDGFCHLNPKPLPPPAPPAPSAPPAPAPEPELEAEPEPEDTEESWLQELQDIYGFFWQEIRDWQKEFGLDQLYWAMSQADGDKEEFFKFLYGHSLEGWTLLPSYKVGQVIVLKFGLRNNYTGELMEEDEAKKLAANLTAALVSKDGKKDLVILLNQENRDICLLAVFDPETSQFVITWDTTGSEPGNYELYLGILKNFCGFLAPSQTILTAD